MSRLSAGPSSSSSCVLIYGATGYTGTLIAERAREVGFPFEVAGRSDSEKLRALATRLGVKYRVFALDAAAPGVPADALANVAVLLNCAGPFAHTARPLLEACIDRGVHYLDITAELKVYQLALSLSARAKSRGVMLLPGVGWDVVPTDCLAAHTVARVSDPQSLRIALQVAGSMSRGSAISAGEIVSLGTLVRADGVLQSSPNAKAVPFDFGAGAVECAPLSFGDLVTAYESTKVPNIAMFVHISGAAFPTGDLAALPDGPSAAERDAHRARAAIEVVGADGRVARSVIETVSGYSYTPLAAIEAAKRVLAGDHRPGFQTPAMVFGKEFAETIAGTTITDYVLEPAH